MLFSLNEKNIIPYAVIGLKCIESLRPGLRRLLAPTGSLLRKQEEQPSSGPDSSLDNN